MTTNRKNYGINQNVRAHFEIDNRSPNVRHKKSHYHISV